MKAHKKRKLGFYPEDPAINKNSFLQCSWTDFNRGAEESIPVNMSVARGNFVSMHCFVGADHAGYTEMRQSQTTILLFCKSVPIIWFINRQNSFEASMFVSEFTAMKNSVEIIESLQYKLRMFGVPINVATNIFCDNNAVCVKTTRPDSTLSKKHHIITYHCALKAVETGTFRVSK